jgi:hypothetical protein
MTMKLEEFEESFEEVNKIHRVPIKQTSRV